MCTIIFSSNMRTRTRIFYISKADFYSKKAALAKHSVVLDAPNDLIESWLKIFLKMTQINASY